MNFRYRKTLLQIGDGLEIAGNITLAAAAIFGILSTFIVLCVAESESKKSRETDSNPHINIIYINTDSCGSHRHHNDDNSSFYSDLLVSSAICSMIGIVLAIHFQVYWVAITVVSLWTAAAALSYMGRALINYALTLQDPNLQALAPSYGNEDSTLTPSAPMMTEATRISDEDARYYQPALAHWAGYGNVSLVNN